jgi:hypothetical protein
MLLWTLSHYIVSIFCNILMTQMCAHCKPSIRCHKTFYISSWLRQKASSTAIMQYNIHTGDESFGRDQDDIYIIVNIYKYDEQAIYIIICNYSSFTYFFITINNIFIMFCRVSWWALNHLCLKFKIVIKVIYFSSFNVLFKSKEALYIVLYCIDD